MSQENRNQGEGNREAAKRYNEAQQSFVEDGGVEEAAEDRRKLSDEEKAEAERAEKAGKARAKETDPNVVRDFEEAAE